MKKNYFILILMFVWLLKGFSALCFSQEEVSESPVSIEDAVLCRDVVDRIPVEPGDVFTNDMEKIYCFTRVVGAAEPTEIRHNWYFGEDMVASVVLPVRSANWRTFSSKTLIPEYTGEWRVEVLSQEGDLLKKIIFMIK